MTLPIKSWRMFTVVLLVTVALITDNIWFLVWRGNNPPNDPGGPLWPMGPWVLCWNGFVNFSVIPLAPCLAGLFVFLYLKFTARYGTPPALPPDYVEDPAIGRVVVSGSIIGLMGLAFLLATSPPHRTADFPRYIGLMSLTIPLILAMLPKVRIGALQWATWLVSRR